jgi:aminoglycoside phosphotransferase (APT) family kinase protein
MADDRDKLERVAQQIDQHSRLLRAWELKGGVSAEVTALELQRYGGRIQKLIVRRHGDLDFYANPNIAADEFRLLELVRAAGVPAPRPYLLDVSGAIFSRPYIVVEYVEGETDFAPSDMGAFVRQLATQLAGIHMLAPSRVNISFLPDQACLAAEKVKLRPAILDDTLNEGRIRDALEAVWPVPQRNAPVLLHGDFWPGNILWKGGRLVAVLDWEDATVGDPLVDVAGTRLELLWACGIDAMQGFTQEYRSLTSLDWMNLPFWDLYAALRPAHRLSEWAGDAAVEHKMREGHRLFVEQAFESLAARSAK